MTALNASSNVSGEQNEVIEAGAECPNSSPNHLLSHFVLEFGRKVDKVIPSRSRRRNRRLTTIYELSESASEDVASSADSTVSTHLEWGCRHKALAV